jgi:hypothetical protein
MWPINQSFFGNEEATRGKRVRLEGVSIYTTADVLRIAREDEVH